MPEQDPWVSVDVVAKHLGIARNTVYRWIDAKGLPAHRSIARLLDARGLITSADAQQASGLDAAGVHPHLKRLFDEGRAATEGQRRGMKYRRADG